MIKRPVINVLFISGLTAVYAFLFIFIAEHMEFQSLLRIKGDLQAPFINSFTVFLMNGSIKFIGYAFIAAAALIVLISIVRWKHYDEYQAGVLRRCVMAVGILTIISVPLLFVCILSDPSYSIEFIFLFIIAHWSVVLLTDLVYVILYAR